MDGAWPACNGPSLRSPGAGQVGTCRHRSDEEIAEEENRRVDVCEFSPEDWT
jgi:hypothetical protein